jgi:hypothetical protein
MTDAYTRLCRWRDVGDDPDLSYMVAGSSFGADVIALLAERDALAAQLEALRAPGGDDGLGRPLETGGTNAG